MQKLGHFNITSGRMKISDPCYDKETTHMGVVPALNGRWNAYIEYFNCGSWGKHVSRLMVIHESENQYVQPWQTAVFEVGVDSGQAGFWDSSFDTSEGDYEDENSTYRKICNLTYDEENGTIQAGTNEYGAFSSSGYGDGGFECKYAFNKDGIMIAAYIDFIPAEYEEEEGLYDDEYEEELEYAGDPD